MVYVAALAIFLIGSLCTVGIFVPKFRLRIARPFFASQTRLGAVSSALVALMAFSLVALLLGPQAWHGCLFDYWLKALGVALVVAVVLEHLFGS